MWEPWVKFGDRFSFRVAIAFFDDGDGDFCFIFFLLDRSALFLSIDGHRRCVGHRVRFGHDATGRFITAHPTPPLHFPLGLALQRPVSSSSSSSSTGHDRLCLNPFAEFRPNVTGFFFGLVPSFGIILFFFVKKSIEFFFTLVTLSWILQKHDFGVFFFF